MHVHHPPGYLHGAGESDGDVPDRHRHGVAVDDHQAALRIDDQPGAVVVALGDARHRVRHVEGHHGERGGERVHARIRVARELRRARRRGLGRRTRRQVMTVPQPGTVVALAVMRREPQPVHADGVQLGAVGGLDRQVAHAGALAVAELRDARLEVLQGVDLLAVQRQHHRPARHTGGAEHVAGVGDVHPAGRHVQVSRLLVGERVHHRVPELRVGARGDGVQIPDREFRGNGLAAALQLHFHLAADAVVERLLEGLEAAHVVAVQAHQDVPGLQHLLAGTAGQHLRHDQHAGVARKLLAHGALGAAGEPQALELIVGGVVEDGVERAARHGLALLDELQRALHAPERQIEARGGAAGAAGIERHHAAADIDDRGAGGAAGGARGRLQVEGVEVVVLGDPVLGRVAIQARERAGEDRQLLAGVVADHADLAPDLRPFRVQRQRLGLDEAQLLRVVTVDAEVVHRVAVHRVQLHFLAVEEGRLRGHRPRGHDVTVGEDQAALGVHHEAGRLRGGVPLGVEGARQVDVDRDHARGDVLERHGPVRIALDRHGGLRGVGLLTGLAPGGRRRGWRRPGRREARRCTGAGVRWRRRRRQRRSCGRLGGSRAGPGGGARRVWCLREGRAGIKEQAQAQGAQGSHPGFIPNGRGARSTRRR